MIIWTYFILCWPMKKKTHQWWKIDDSNSANDNSFMWTRYVKYVNKCIDVEANIKQAEQHKRWTRFHQTVVVSIENRKNTIALRQCQTIAVSPRWYTCSWYILLQFLFSMLTTTVQQKCIHRMRINAHFQRCPFHVRCTMQCFWDFEEKLTRSYHISIKH